MDINYHVLLSAALNIFLKTGGRVEGGWREGGCGHHPSLLAFFKKTPSSVKYNKYRVFSVSSFRSLVHLSPPPSPLIIHLNFKSGSANPPENFATGVAAVIHLNNSQSRGDTKGVLFRVRRVRPLLRAVFFGLDIVHRWLGILVVAFEEISRFVVSRRISFRSFVDFANRDALWLVTFLKNERVYCIISIVARLEKKRYEFIQKMLFRFLSIIIVIID